MRTVYGISLVLVIIGALNWGLVGLFQFDLVAALFGGQQSGLSRAVYTLVGLAGVLAAVTSPAMVTDRGVHRTATSGDTRL
jgi:uncharacterized membrane protein YuzA (DUF378 family)